MQIEYAVARGACGRELPNQGCDTGFTLQGNRCVTIPQQPKTCPPGAVLENGSCLVYFDKPNTPQQSESDICRNDYGSHSIWTGERNSDGGVVCSCANGYDFIDSSDTCKLVPENQGVSADDLQAQLDTLLGAIDNLEESYVQSPATPVPVAQRETYIAPAPLTCANGTVLNDSKNACITADKACKDRYGVFGRWPEGNVNQDGQYMCSCEVGYVLNAEQVCVAEVGEQLLEEEQVNATSRNESFCNDNYGEMSLWSGEINDAGGPICNCTDGFEFNELYLCEEVQVTGSIISFFRGLVRSLFNF